MSDQINVSYTRTISLDNMEFVKIQAGITQEISPQDERSNEEIFNFLFEQCEDFVLEKCQKEVEE